MYGRDKRLREYVHILFTSHPSPSKKKKNREKYWLMTVEETMRKGKKREKCEIKRTRRKLKGK
jgi:hypothetical protein